MQAALALLAIVPSTVWLAVDASKRDWTDNAFAKNVPTWVVGSLVLWIIVFPLYVFVQRKKAPLKARPAAPSRPAPVAAVAMVAPRPSEQYGPSLDELSVEPEPIVETEPEPVAEIEPDPVVEPEPERVAEPEPVLEISHPEAPVEQAPPGLSVDAFKDIKPVAFGGFAADEADAEPAVQEPMPEPDVQPEPVLEAEPEPVVEPEPVAEAEPEPVVEPEPVAEAEPEPVAEPEPLAELEPIAYPLETEPVIEPEPELEPVVEPEPEPALAAAVAEPVAEQPKAKKRGLRLPNPELRMPSFRKNRAKPAPAAAKEPKTKRGLKLPSAQLKLPSVTLPPNLRGPLNELERKIVVGSTIVIVAAAAFGYLTAPSDDAPAPAPAPAAASR